MEWPLVSNGEFFRLGLVVLFFWVLIGQYVYREAKQQAHASPKIRGLCWGVIGVAGVVVYLTQIREREKNRLGWIGFSILLFVFWAMGTIGQQDLDGWYAWAGFFAGLFILYWKFYGEIFDELGDNSTAE